MHNLFSHQGNAVTLFSYSISLRESEPHQETDGSFGGRGSRGGRESQGRVEERKDYHGGREKITKKR